MHRELGCMHLMAHRAHASVCGLGLQQVFNQPPCLLRARTGPLFDQVQPGARHAVQAQLFELCSDITHG